MDYATASKYRVILFGDQEDTNPLPPSLVKLHNFAFQRLQRFGMGAISREMALTVVMQWMQTDDGRHFFEEPVGESLNESTGEQAPRPRGRPRLNRETDVAAPV